MHIFTFLGAPGAGKGTVASRLAAEYDIPHISTGDLFRYNISEDTALGREAKSYMDKGDLVPDDVTSRMVEDRIARDDCKKGFILDGYPRTVAQADTLAEILKKNGLELTKMILVEVPEDMIVARLSGRRVCEDCGKVTNVGSADGEGVCECGGKLIRRKDDTEETIRHRFKTYEEKTAPLIQYYEDLGKLLSIKNVGPIEDAMTELFGKLK